MTHPNKLFFMKLSFHLYHFIWGTLIVLSSETFFSLDTMVSEVYEQDHINSSEKTPNIKFDTPMDEADISVSLTS